jgi:hypothetical protein
MNNIQALKEFYKLLYVDKKIQDLIPQQQTTLAEVGYLDLNTQGINQRGMEIKSPPTLYVRNGWLHSQFAASKST